MCDKYYSGRCIYEIHIYDENSSSLASSGVPFKHFRKHLFEGFSEVFGGTLGVTKHLVDIFHMA